MSHENSSSTSSRSGTSVWRWQNGHGTWGPDEVVVEEPLEIRVDNHAISVTMRTPGNDEELALGFLLTEQVIAASRDVQKVSRCGTRREGSNVVHVRLAPHVTLDVQRLTRHVFASSSCGLCGKSTIDAIAQCVAPVTSDLRVSPELIASLPEQMRDRQVTFSRTGGLHAAALFDERGALLVLREDIGRHNAVDKVIGWAIATGRMPLDRHVLLVSGRSSFEIMQKALAASIPIVAAVSAPSSLAIDFAERNGQTLVGFLRDDRMNVYTHSYRIGAELDSTSSVERLPRAPSRLIPLALLPTP